jgi:hypothetical protein
MVRYRDLIMEGGNVFKNEEDVHKTQRINKADIQPTVAWLESIVGIDLLNNLVGSVGKKVSSGDLDIAVDSNTTSKHTLVQKLYDWVLSHNLDPDDYIKSSRKMVHFMTPIKGDMSNGFVQTDFMLVPNTSWTKFSMHSPGDASKFTGADRNKLMSVFARALGMKYSWNHGLMDRDSNKLISRDPDTIAKYIFGPTFGAGVFHSVEQMLFAYKDNKNLHDRIETLLAQYETSDNDALQKQAAYIRHILA